MQSSRSRRSLVNYAGIAILIAGLACGEFVYWRSLGSGDGAPVSLTGSKAYEHEMETQTGKFGIIVNQFMRRAGEPGPLAAAICVGVGGRGGDLFHYGRAHAAGLKPRGRL